MIDSYCRARMAKGPSSARRRKMRQYQTPIDEIRNTAPSKASSTDIEQKSASKVPGGAASTEAELYRAAQQAASPKSAAAPATEYGDAASYGDETAAATTAAAGAADLP